MAVEQQQQASYPCKQYLSSIVNAEQLLIPETGKTGHFHHMLLIYETTAVLNVALHNLLLLVIAPPTKYWCLLPDPPNNLTEKEWKDINIPRNTDGSLSGCFMYKPGGNDTLPEDNGTSPAIPCTAWKFEITGTIIEEWSLVCSSEPHINLMEFLYSLGGIVGLLSCGIVSDRVGRKPVICFCSIVLEVTGIMVVSANSLYSFMALRFLVSYAVCGIAHTNYVLLLEQLATESRGLYGSVVSCGYIFGLAVIFLIQSFRLNWQAVQTFIMLPTSVLLMSFTLLTESPRWLLANSTVRNTSTTVAEIMRRNGANTAQIQEAVERVKMQAADVMSDVSHSRASVSKDRRRKYSTSG